MARSGVMKQQCWVVTQRDPSQTVIPTEYVIGIYLSKETAETVVDGWRNYHPNYLYTVEESTIHRSKWGKDDPDNFQG